MSDPENPEKGNSAEKDKKEKNNEEETKTSDSDNPTGNDENNAPPASPDTGELPGEFGDAEWSEADEYGFSRSFPYQKKDAVIHDKGETLPPYAKPESAEESPDELLGETPAAVLDNGEAAEWVAIDTSKLQGYELALHHIDTAATSLAALLGKITTRSAYMPRTPANTATGFTGYTYSGESEMTIDVETDVKSVTSISRVRPDMIDEETQVHAIDIIKAYREHGGKSEHRHHRQPGEEGTSTEDSEEEANRLIVVERKPSKRVDDMTLTHPLGYKELELSLPTDAVTFEAGTQVKTHEIDQEFAMLRGYILPNDDILWPSVAEFGLEVASKRVQDYIDECWTLDPKWKYHVHPVQTIADEYRKRFVLEVKFSVPTPLNPIPPATASVFFIFEISHYAPKDETVRVHYVIEGTRFLHAPGTLPFQDKWLWSVISDKVRVQRSIDF